MPIEELTRMLKMVGPPILPTGGIITSSEGGSWTLLHIEPPLDPDKHVIFDERDLTESYIFESCTPEANPIKLSRQELNQWEERGLLTCEPELERTPFHHDHPVVNTLKNYLDSLRDTEYVSMEGEHSQFSFQGHCLTFKLKGKYIRYENSYLTVRITFDGFALRPFGLKIDAIDEKLLSSGGERSTYLPPRLYIDSPLHDCLSLSPATFSVESISEEAVTIVLNSYLNLFNETLSSFGLPQ